MTGTNPGGSNGSVWLSTAWEALAPRDQDMLVRHRNGETLDAIGRHHHVSGERARQIIKKGGESLVLASRWVEDSWRAKVDDLLDHSPAVADREFSHILVDPEGAARYALLRALGARHPRTWSGLLRGFWTFEQEALSAALREIASHAPYRPGELRAHAAAVNIPGLVPVETIFMASGSPLLPTSEGAWLRRSVAGRDAAYLWLADEGEPRRLEDVAEALGGDCRAVRESMRRDDRFRQVRPEGTWALTEWPLPGISHYTNALEAVVAVLTELGPMSKRRLFAEVARRYPVGQARLHKCLHSGLVGVVEDGTIDLVERGADPILESEPKRPGHVAVDPDGNVLGFRVTVSRELLRGSGVPVHRWITWYLGLRHAPASRNFVFADSAGVLTVSRNTSAAQISALRKHALKLGVACGCVLVVVLRLDEDSASLRHACAADSCPARCGPEADGRGSSGAT